ncbi:uncharacterized protein FFNC_14617 [Fusarium fujikuroi]|nr:uncharacterized protein FFNC_14617 [Fusarium fujikuroi]
MIREVGLDDLLSKRVGRLKRGYRGQHKTFEVGWQEEDSGQLKSKALQLN